MERQVISHKLVQQNGGKKKKNTFVVFDIKGFHLSVSQYLLQKVLEFAKTKVSIN